MRSGKIQAKNDELIMQLLNDPLYDVREDGTVWTKVMRTGWIGSEWREAGRSERTPGRYIDIGYKGTRVRTHRIIYAKFNGPLSSDLVVNHIDGNVLNNHPSNLELVPQKENNRHAWRPGGRVATKGNAKITQEIAENIRKESESGMSYRQLVRKYGITKGSISAIVNFKTWKTPA